MQNTQLCIYFFNLICIAFFKWGIILDKETESQES